MMQNRFTNDDDAKQKVISKHHLIVYRRIQGNGKELHSKAHFTHRKETHCGQTRKFEITSHDRRQASTP